MSAEAVNPLIYKARLAEQAERYDDMAEFMTQYVKENGAVDEDGRNLLSVAYKNKIGTKRSSWRIVSAEESRSTDAEFIAVSKEYRGKIEQEIFTIHDTVVKLIDEYLLKTPEGSSDDDKTVNESKVFFNKMKGDYSRYKAEITTGEEREKASTSSLNAYQAAQGIADDELPTTHPMRLGLSLNFSVFHYEILSDPKKACEIAKEAFDNAIAHLDTVSEKDYKDSTLIMQLLRDNLTLWTSDTQREAEEEQ